MFGRITAMMTLLLTLVGLLALGVLTHVAPNMRKGRVGYPRNPSVELTLSRPARRRQPAVFRQTGLTAQGCCQGLSSP
jgi:hypothetical protein